MGVHQLFGENSTCMCKQCQPRSDCSRKARPRSTLFVILPKQTYKNTFRQTRPVAGQGSSQVNSPIVHDVIHYLLNNLKVVRRVSEGSIDGT